MIVWRGSLPTLSRTQVVLAGVGVGADPVEEDGEVFQLRCVRVEGSHAPKV